MACDCRKELEAKLLERFKTQTPGAKSHEAQLKGYSIALFGDAWSLVGVMPIELIAEHPLKKGGFRVKRETSNMIFTYCPFCGKKYNEAKGDAE